MVQNWADIDLSGGTNGFGKSSSDPSYLTREFLCAWSAHVSTEQREVYSIGTHGLTHS